MGIMAASAAAAGATISNQDHFSAMIRVNRFSPKFMNMELFVLLLKSK
jgi:hypothetical protein